MSERGAGGGGGVKVLTGDSGRSGECAGGGELVAHVAAASGKVVAFPRGVVHGGVDVEAAEAEKR
jgi:hypothetical protein